MKKGDVVYHKSNLTCAWVVTVPVCSDGNVMVSHVTDTGSLIEHFFMPESLMSEAEQIKRKEFF